MPGRAARTTPTSNPSATPRLRPDPSVKGRGPLLRAPVPRPRARQGAIIARAAPPAAPVPKRRPPPPSPPAVTWGRRWPPPAAITPPAPTAVAGRLPARRSARGHHTPPIPSLLSPPFRPARRAPTLRRRPRGGTERAQPDRLLPSEPAQSTPWRARAGAGHITVDTCRVPRPATPPLPPHSPSGSQAAPRSRATGARRLRHFHRASTPPSLPPSWVRAGRVRVLMLPTEYWLYWHLVPRRLVPRSWREPRVLTISSSRGLVWLVRLCGRDGGAWHLQGRWDEVPVPHRAPPPCFRCRHFAVRQQRAGPQGCCLPPDTQSWDRSRAAEWARPCSTAFRPTPSTAGESRGQGWGGLRLSGGWAASCSLSSRWPRARKPVPWAPSVGGVVEESRAWLRAGLCVPLIGASLLLYFCVLLGILSRCRPLNS